MDKSTENVTLIAAFITDILDLYQGKADYVKLKQMSSHLDLTDPMRHVPIDTYNEMCNWIESEIGQANTRMLGRKIGETAYQSMLKFNMVNEDSSPVEMMTALQKVATTIVKDPKKRGWEVLSSGAKEVILRRTQTFNGTLQLGLLDALIRKTKVISPSVFLIKEVAKGAEYDEYKITWL